MQAFIVQGDKTSHGGTVLTGSPFSDCEGKPIARVGDMCSCPMCHGMFPIVQGDNSTIMDGAAVAYHGCKLACGATIVSSQLRTLTEPSAGAAPAATNAVPEGFGDVGAGMAAAYEEVALGAGSGRFQGRFQLVSLKDARPIRGKQVRVRAADGQYLAMTTDADGYTEWVEREAAEALTFDFAEQAN